MVSSLKVHLEDLAYKYAYGYTLLYCDFLFYTACKYLSSESITGIQYNMSLHKYLLRNT
jgi:hypothetical protein